MRTISCIVFFVVCVLQLNAQPTFPKHLSQNLRETSINYAKQHGMPLCLMDAVVEYNADTIPVLKLFTQNVTMKNIETYTIEVYCYDKHKQPVYNSSTQTNVYVGNSQDFKPCLSDVYFPEIYTLEGYDSTTKVKIYLKKVFFWDGDIWTPNDKKVTLIESGRFNF
mgnify:CR=1 FL=1